MGDINQHFSVSRSLAIMCAVGVLAGCAWGPSTIAEDSLPPLRKEKLQVLTRNMELITVNAGQPQRVLRRVGIQGLPSGEVLIGMDYRVAKGVLFAMGKQGNLYTLDTQTGDAKVVASTPISPPLEGSSFGFDFNPVADRIRVVSNTGQNLRLHPETGMVASVDPELAYVAGDPQGLNKPEVVAAAYTYNKQDDKLTTNYAIDKRLGMLVTQGSIEGLVPAVSPNTGRLRTVGSLTLGPLVDASFDIADVTGAGFAAVRSIAISNTRLVLVDLQTGKAEVLGQLADGSPVVGLAVEP